MLPTNRDIAAALTELADRLELAGEKPYRMRAYRTAAKRMGAMQVSLAQMAAAGTLTEIDGVGATIADKVTEFVRAGTFPALEQARADVSDGLLVLTQVSGVGGATARKVVDALGTDDLDALVAAAESGALADAAGIAKGPKASIPAELPALAEAFRARHGRGEVVDRAEARAAAAAAQDVVGATATVEIAGTFARGHELIEGIDLLISGDGGATAVEALVDAGWQHDPDRSPDSPDWIASTALLSPLGTVAALHVAAADRAEEALTWLIGPAGYPESGSTTRPAELRDQPDLQPLAGADAELVRLADIRGDLHMHTTFSDGDESVATMCEAALELGYDYFAITDHSAPYALVGGLDGDKLATQLEDIEAARDQFAGRLTILHGIELEITPSDGLGLPDEVLERLDWVNASIHQSQRQDRATLEARMRHALDNPLVDCIAHPSSRLVGMRPPTELDIEWLIAECAATGTCLELNANPRRLDLNAQHARLAAEAGVPIVISTDAHAIEHLDFMEHGVAIARRAGLSAEHVLNTKSVDEVTARRPRAAAASQA